MPTSANPSNKMRVTLMVFLAAIVFDAASQERDIDRVGGAGTPDQQEFDRSARLARMAVQSGIEVTFYPGYGYKQGTNWTISVQGDLHERGRRINRRSALAGVAHRILECQPEEIDAVRFRLRDFVDEDPPGERVAIEFDSDPKKVRYSLTKSDANGRTKTDLTLSETRAQELIQSQRSIDGWLTYHSVSKRHIGMGRIRLIEPTGISIISDIDDTIKVSAVPGPSTMLLRNTFCRGFETAPTMADRFRTWGHPVHYVSGGPWQLYAPLYDYLIAGPVNYPEGAFHLNYFPKNILSVVTIERLLQVAAGTLADTYRHKLASINDLVTQFPGRKFILVGDSGEVDPEVYRAIKDKYPGSVEEIWIRDVVNDAAVNPARLDGMKIIKVEPVICATDNHYNKIKNMREKLKLPAYLRNTQSPCDRGPNAPSPP